VKGHGKFRKLCTPLIDITSIHTKMRVFLPLLSLTLAHGDTMVPATSPLLQWTGRSVEEGTTRVFDWLNIQCIFSVSGATSVFATLNSTFWSSPPTPPIAGRSLQQAQFPKFGVYRVYVNGVRQGSGELDGIVVHAGQAEYPLVTNLDPTKTYNVSLWYTTDPVFNSWPDLDLGRGCVQKVVSLRTDGAFVSPPPPRTLSMLVLGDSITSGNAMYKPCDNATKCDASQSYISLLGEAFQLNLTQLTASSKGLLHNCCDKLNVTVPILAERTFAQDNSTMWDWEGVQFDAIFINLGQNDGGQSPPAVFTAAYLALVTSLIKHGKSPSTPIFAAWGPILDFYAPWVKAAKASADAMGLNVVLVDMMGPPLDGCGHPGVEGHPQMARIAAPIIANATGWPYKFI
jgi:hypothetical protein